MPLIVLLYVSSYVSQHSAYADVCGRMLTKMPLIVLLYIYICPHTCHNTPHTLQVDACRWMCPSSSALSMLHICPHTPICVFILLYICPHTAIYVSSYYYICVLTLLYMCPHTTIQVSSHYYTCFLILLYVLIPLHICPHTTKCPHNTIHVCVPCRWMYQNGRRGRG